MSRYTITPETIEAVTRAGFDVYMRTPDDSWLIFTDGKNLGNLQNSAFGGFDLSTIHVPNLESGTGYRLEDGVGLADLTPDFLRRAFIYRPNWAPGTRTVQKFDGIEAYRKSSPFHAAYHLIAQGQR